MANLGILCPRCETVVIHMPKLAKMLLDGPLNSGWEVGPEFAVFGLVDLDAVPPEEAHIPILDFNP